MSGIGEYFPDCGDNVKDMIRRSITALSPDGDHQELLTKLDSEVIASFWISLQVDHLPVLEVTFKESGLMSYILSIKPGYAQQIESINAFMDAWHLPRTLQNYLTRIRVFGSEGEIVSWSGSGIVSRDQVIEP